MLITYVYVLHTVCINYIFTLICIIIDLFYQGLLAVQFLELLNSSASGAKRDSGTKVNAALAIDPNIQGDSIIYFQRSNFRFILVFYSALWVGCLSCFGNYLKKYSDHMNSYLSKENPQIQHSKPESYTTPLRPRIEISTS